MDYESWQPRARIEQEYKNSLKALIKSISSMLQNISNPSEIISMLREISNSESMANFAGTVASRMITGLTIQSARTWRAAASQSIRGRAIHQALVNEMNGMIGVRIKELIAENAKLISSFPSDISQEIASHISKLELQGQRPSAITESIVSQFPHIAKSRISLVARTETSKASSALTQARSEELNLNWYVWRTSKDARVRSSHRHMEGVLINWGDIPNPELLNHEKSTAGSYHAGNVWNCRCYSEPLIDLNLIKWPAKIHFSGVISRIEKRKFEQMEGMRIAA